MRSVIMDQRLLSAEGNEDVNIVLIGKSGAGKSATGNTILDAEEFPSEQRWSTVTEQCCRRSAVVGDWRVAVTDTPDLLSAHNQNNDLQAVQFRSLCSPGVHAFLFILSINTFTRQELDLLSQFEQVFGEAVFRFTVVVFTHGDWLKRRPVDELIRRNFQLLHVINRCGGGYHVLNNADRSNRQQVTELLQKIDRMVSVNGNNCYTLEILKEAERRAREERGRISEEQRREEERAQREHQMNLEAEERVHREVRQNRDEEEKEKNEDKSVKVLVLKCVIVMMIFSPVSGCVLMWSKGSADFWTFLGGCAVGASAAGIGAFTGKIWPLMLKSPFRTGRLSPQGSPTEQFLKKLAGVLSGGLLGSVMAHMFSGQAAVSLIAGLAGATGAFFTAHCSRFP